MSCAGSLLRGWRTAGAPCGQETQPFFHRLAATRTGDDAGWFYWRGGQCADEQRSAGVEGDALALDLRRRVAEAVVTDCPQAAWQDVAEVAHGWIGMAVVIDGIALGASADGAVFEWQLLVSRLVGLCNGSTWRVFGLSRAAGRSWIEWLRELA